MREGGVGGGEVLDAVADAAVILAPCHFRGIGGEVRAGDPVMDAYLSATDAREEALRLIGAGLAIRIGFGVIDALRQEAGVQTSQDAASSA